MKIMIIFLIYLKNMKVNILILMNYLQLYLLLEVILLIVINGMKLLLKIF